MNISDEQFFQQEQKYKLSDSKKGTKKPQMKHLRVFLGGEGGIRRKYNCENP